MALDVNIKDSVKDKKKEVEDRISDLEKKLNSYNPKHNEGPIAKKIEKTTAKIPSDVYLWASVAAIGVSAIFKATKQHKTALFVGQWASPFMLLGIYNKLVKQNGHD